jgi:hypothetical protein
MKDQTNEAPLDPMPGELPVTASRPGTAPAWCGGKHGAVPVDPGEIWIRLHYGGQPKPKGTGKLAV